jgi:probable HAF family extracellular repeat protein
MRTKLLARLVVTALFSSLALSVLVVAQEEGRTQQHRGEQRRYKIIDTGTLGGPTSSLGFEGERDINNRGVLVSTAETSSLDPFPPPNCFLGDCFLSHTVEWQDGVLTDLRALPGGNSGPIWISDSGLISGLSQNGLTDPATGTPEFRAVLWKNGTLIDLGTFGGNEACPGAVNNRGQVVGAATTAIDDPFSLCFGSQQSRAFLWENGAKKDIGTLGGPDAIAEFINERGQVAGISLIDSTVNSNTGSPTQHPFLWEDGKMRDLGTIGGTLVAGVNHLNDLGEVVGAMFTEGDQTFHPFLWNGRAMKDLGTLGGDFGGANWVNDAGDVVGFAADQTGAFFAFLWKYGVVANLGAVDGDPCSAAFAINSKKQVVGSSEKCDGTFVHAFLWEDGQIIDLNKFVPSGFGVQLTAAPAINDRGEIAAQGVLSNGETHAFVLIPCEDDEGQAEGCEEAGEIRATAAKNTAGGITLARPAVVQTDLTASEMKQRVRAMLISRNRRFRELPPK